MCHLRAPTPHGAGRRVKAFCLLISHLAASSQGPPRQHTALYCSCLLLAAYSFLPQLIPLRCHVTCDLWFSSTWGHANNNMWLLGTKDTSLVGEGWSWINPRPGFNMTCLHFCLFPILLFVCTTRASGILDPQPGIEPRPPSVEAWNSNHWTNREIPVLYSLPHKWFWTCFLKSCSSKFIGLSRRLKKDIHVKCRYVVRAL